MKILVTGAKGMLGNDLLSILALKHQVTGLDIEELDITDLDKTTKSLKLLAPDVVINSAAYTNVDACESNIDLAYRVNSLGPRNLAVACNQIGAALVQLSTDYVFPGTSSEPYREDDPTGPISIYGKSKLAGENNIRTLTNRFYIVRTSWLFGQNGPNFIKTILRLAGERDLLTVVDDQTGSPTYTGDLAQAIAKLIETNAYGSYHLTNSGTCTWYQFTKEILQEAGITGVEVKPITTGEFNRPAPRPAYSVMDNQNWRLLGFEPLRSYKEALRAYLAKEATS